jgi:hypothetical protein
VGLVVLLAACSADTASLEDRLREVLADGEAGVEVDGADVSCPADYADDVGDRVTCVVTGADGTESEVDVELREGGAIAVVAVVPR